MTARLLEVGHIGRAHGVRGELYVDLLTDRHERLAVGARLKAGGRWLTVGAARAVGSRWLVQFDECADRTSAELLTGTALLAEELSDLGGGLYVHQLIGARVVDTDGREFGRCAAVVANPAHDLLELDDGSLVPAVFVVSAESGRVVIDPPQGLFELGE